MFTKEKLRRIESETDAPPWEWSYQNLFDYHYALTFHAWDQLILIVIRMDSRGKESCFGIKILGKIYYYISGCFMEELISYNNVKKRIPEKFAQYAGQFCIVHRDDDIVLISFTIWKNVT